MLALNKLRFPFSDARFSHQKYFCLTNWDAQVAFYSFCAEFHLANNRAIALQTMFVPVLPESWENGFSSTDCLLACLAERWLKILVKEPRVVDELLPSEQGRLAALLLWRYRSGAAIKYKAMTTSQGKNNQYMRISRKFLERLEKTPLTHLSPDGEGLHKWLSLRPGKACQTMFICADLSPDNISNPAQAALLRSVTPDFEKEIEPAGIYLARFFKAQANEKRYTMKIADEKVVLDWLNSRVEYCSEEKSTKRTFSALFPNIKMNDFIAKAKGSPGLMVLLADRLLEPYISGVKNPSELEFIDSDTLLGQAHL
jgi:hypothetical protein